jgi:hypothetical protein
MLKTLWIWSARNQWFTTGKFIIIGDYATKIPFSKLQEMVYNSWSIKLHEPFVVPSHRQLAVRLASPYHFKTPEEITKILYGPKNEISDRLYPR